MKRTDQATIIFRLPPEIKKQLQIKVLEEGTSIQELLENFANNYLEEGNKMLKSGVISFIVPAEKYFEVDAENLDNVQDGDICLVTVDFRNKKANYVWHPADENPANYPAIKDDFNAVTESFEKEIKETIFLEAIKKGNREQSDFDIGFDLLFEFMEKHPESNTTKNFIQYYAELEEVDKTTHALQDGSPCFLYLIGLDFLPHDWVDEDDMKTFRAFVLEADIEPQYKDEIVQEIEAN